MTAIAIWHDNETPGNPFLWVAADSLVSNHDAPLIEDAAKVLSLPVICRSADVSGAFSVIHYAHTYGYCFAGSTLMGQNSYLALAPLLSNLKSLPRYSPSLADVAQYVLRFLKLTFDDYKVRVNGTAKFEVAIFGYCHQMGQLSAYHFEPSLVDGVWQMILTHHPLQHAGDFLYLGSAKPQMIDAIRQGFTGPPVPGKPLGRMPRYVIQNVIDNELYDVIGGDIQLGIANQFGFQPLMLAKPRVIGTGEMYFSYLGREVTHDMQYLGQALVFPGGMV